MFVRASIVFLVALALGFIGVSDARAGDTAQPSSVPNGMHCDGIFHLIYVLGAENLDGSETGFEYICQTGSPGGPLLVYLQGIGACWDGPGCDCQPNASGVCTNPNPNAFLAQGFFKKSNSDDGLTWAETYWGGGNSGSAANSALGYGAGTEAAAFAGPTSPFTGYRNITVDLIQIKSLFPNPEKIAIWGASSGGAGSDCNLSLFRAAWPNTDMWKMSNALPAIDMANLMPLFPSVTQTWGVWEPGLVGRAVIEHTCPIIAPPGSTDWNLGWVVQFNAKEFENVRKAFTDDYADATVDVFACLMGATPNSSGSCSAAVGATMTAEFNHIISEAKNYKVFYHTGKCHAERGALSD